MVKHKKVALLIRDKEKQYEGLRSSLGLLLENHKVCMIVLTHEIELIDEYHDNMQFIDEMGGHRWSDNKINAEHHGFRYLPFDEIAHKLRDFEIIIPF